MELASGMGRRQTGDASEHDSDWISSHGAFVPFGYVNCERRLVCAGAWYFVVVRGRDLVAVYRATATLFRDADTRSHSRR